MARVCSVLTITCTRLSVRHLPSLVLIVVNRVHRIWSDTNIRT